LRRTPAKAPAGEADDHCGLWSCLGAVRYSWPGVQRGPLPACPSLSGLVSEARLRPREAVRKLRSPPLHCPLAAPPSAPLPPAMQMLPWQSNSPQCRASELHAAMPDRLFAINMAPIEPLNFQQDLVRKSSPSYTRTGSSSVRYELRRHQNRNSGVKGPGMPCRIKSAWTGRWTSSGQALN